MYDAREKAIRDYQFAINSARQEGQVIGEEIGKEIGKEIGEQIGEERGTLIGKIMTLQEILGQIPASKETLRAMSMEELEALASHLQQSVRSRPAT